MLKLNYNFTLPKQNLKQTKFNFLIITLLWINLITTKKQLSQIKQTKTLKTLMLSPFHYKVAKKNIVKELYKFTVSYDIKIFYYKNNKLIIFYYWKYYTTYFIFLGLNKIQFISYNYTSKC